MDLRLEAAEGCKMPAGSFLAVKLGDALKQGRYEPSRTYQFPNVDKRRHAKIDIFKHVGSAAVLVSPEAGAHVSEVSITSSCPLVEDLRLKVNMVPIGGKESELPKSTIRVKAQSYLQKHRVEEKLSSCMKLLLQERPCDPIDFICSNLRGDEPWCPPSACDVEIQTDPVKIEDFCFDGDSRPVIGELCSGIGDSSDGQDIRELTRGLLAQASVDGSLLEILQQDVPADQDLREKTRKKLAAATAGGGLVKLLLDDSEHQVAQSSPDSVENQLKALRSEIQKAHFLLNDLTTQEKKLLETNDFSDYKASDPSTVSASYLGSPKYEPPMTADSRVSIDTFEDAAADAASVLASCSLQERSYVADVRKCEVPQGPPQALAPELGLPPDARNYSRQSPAFYDTFWANLYSKFPQPRRDPLRNALKVTAERNPSKSVQFPEGPFGDVHLAHRSAESGLQASLQEHNGIGCTHPAFSNADASSKALQARADENSDVLLATRALISETHVLLTGAEERQSGGELVAATRALISETEAISGARNITAKPQTEFTANSTYSSTCEADATDVRSAPIISGRASSSAIAERSALTPTCLEQSANSLARPPIQANCDFPLDDACTSWTSKPSVATWLKTNPGRRIIPKRQHWACKPSVGTWLQLASKCVASS